MAHRTRTNMSENRLVTVILWAMLVAGTACLAVVYFVQSGHLNREHPISSTNQRETESSDPIAKRSAGPHGSIPSEAGELTSDGQEREPPISLRSTPPQVLIYETSSPNGSFQAAQEVGEGLIIGRRGSGEDRADYYKVEATGNAMVLKMDTSLEQGRYGFSVRVFDSDQQPIGEDLGEIDSSMSLSVTPQATYYIKLDLSDTPVESPQYRLHVRFE